MTSSLILSLDNENLSFGSRQGLLAHIDACTTNCAYHLTSEDSQVTYGGFIEGFQTTLATFLGEHDRYKDAETLFLKGLSIQQQKLGLENTATLSTLNNLGALYLGARQLEKAKFNLELALKVKENLLGPDHPRTLNSVNNMGNLLTLQMNYDGAAQMFQRALKGYSKINGPMHKTVFESLNNLGEIAMKKGDLEEAEQIFKTAFTKARTSSGGKDSSFVLYLASNIALVYKLQGRYQEALQVYSDVVTGRERLLGVEHSSTLRSMCEVADVYTVLGDEKSASSWYEKGNASMERKERGKLGFKSPTQPQLTISRSADSPPEQSTSRTPANLPISPEKSSGSKDDALSLADHDDQMEWEVSPQSKLFMASNPSPATASLNLKGQHGYLQPIDRLGASSYQWPLGDRPVFQQNTMLPQVTTYGSTFPQEFLADRDGLSFGNHYSPGIGFEANPRVERDGQEFAVLDRVGVSLSQQAANPPFRIQQNGSIDRFGYPSINTAMLGGQTLDRRGMAQFNFNNDDQGWRPGLLNSARNSSAQPRSGCEYIERGGVCMHNVNHMR